MTQARDFFERSLALDPNNIDAMVFVAAVHIVVGAGFQADDRAAHLEVAETTLTKALCHAPNHAFAHLALGVVQSSTKRVAQGVVEYERALTLDQNLADAHALIGEAKIYMGRGAETEAHVEEAFRLSPRDNFVFTWLLIIGHAKLHLTADAEAVSWFRRSIEATRSYPMAHFLLAAALALLDSPDEARPAVKAGLALDPNFALRRYRTGATSDNPTYLAGRERICVGMRLAGVPEG